MKRLLLLLLLPIFSAAQQPVSNEVQIKAAVIKMFDGLSDRNPGKIRACTTDDFLLLENGAVWNNDSLTARMNKLRTTVVNLSG